MDFLSWYYHANRKSKNKPWFVYVVETITSLQPVALFVIVYTGTKFKKDYKTFSSKRHSTNMEMYSVRHTGVHAVSKAYSKHET